MELISYWQRTVAPYVRARFAGNERGAAVVEYALLVALIAVVAIAALNFLGTSTSDKFSQVGSKVAVAGS
jgi:pilus assembly protein Flp/PilA